MKFKIGDVVIPKRVNSIILQSFTFQQKDSFGKEGMVELINKGFYFVNGFWWPEKCLELVIDPDNWCIKNEPNSITDVLKYLKNVYVGDSSYYGFENGERKCGPIPFGKVQLITPEQFYKYIFKKDKPIRGKIIGYKAPFDLFSGGVKKDFIYKPLASVNNKYYAAVNFENKVGLPNLNLPKEIVETWEPVYEELYKEIIIGNPVKIVKISKGKIECEGQEITIEYLTTLYVNFFDKFTHKLNNWSVSISTIEIGCSTFTKEEIKQVLDIYNELNN